MNADIDGFITIFGPGRTQEDWTLYMTLACEQPSCSAGKLAATLESGLKLAVHSDTFNGWGAALVASSGKPGTVTVMDELGFLERDALLFASAVKHRLSSPYPVLGVLRSGCRHWEEILSQCKHTEIITVTADNRDALPEFILKKLNEVTNNDHHDA